MNTFSCAASTTSRCTPANWPGCCAAGRAHVNLIPFNDVDGLPYRRPTTESLQAFTNVLQQAGISVKVRKRKGSQIDAACGQLRRTEQEVTRSPHRESRG